MTLTLHVTQSEIRASHLSPLSHPQVFYWTHMLYIPFWILLILHGPIFWMFFVAPGLLFILEKISRSKIIKRARYGNTHITEVHLLPSGVTIFTI